uniref:Helicase n=1 Tax=viral metagenome TaxID=1070528 RepID=A0A6C0E3Q8_9ZZZZ
MNTCYTIIKQSMVKICSQTYPASKEEVYKSYFEKYSFELSSFQKYSIEAIVEGHHALVCVPTGSGKTLSGEFAIEYFVGKGKKVIYTSPIKALSNQKFYDFSKKFPHISFGILTGDIKFNPEADVLIVTAEILLNTLYKKKSVHTDSIASFSTFDMDFEKELACVVMDEVHYINDTDRGKVWEETIITLPKHIQMVMLSATLDSPEKFAYWCETRGDPNAPIEKMVYLTPAHERIVPLTHYAFITCTTGIFKVIKDKALQQEIMMTTNRLHEFQSPKGRFNDENFQKIKKTLNLFETKNHYVKRAHILNQVSSYMVDNNMLPAICFVFSRKALEVCAKEVTTNLLEFDSKVPYIVRNECEQIIRKLPNYQEYLQLPEYLQMVSLLEKGVAIHHAGIMPVLREMVELLFAKGYIKLLFATETFAVGINMPTKTVVFTDVNKFDGTGLRMLHSHEYTQMAGRAGRRGIDTVGHVIHLNNLFRNVEPVAYKHMMKGDPQRLTSKFKISYNLLLNLIDIGDQHFAKFAKQSMIQENITKELAVIYKKMTDKMKEVEQSMESQRYLRTPRETMEEYLELLRKRPLCMNSKRKELERKINHLIQQYPNLEKEQSIFVKGKEKEKELTALQDEITKTESYIESNVDKVIRLLEEGQFVTKNDDGYTLTLKGQIASQIREVHCLLFTNCIVENSFQPFTTEELVSIFSCFTNVTVPENFRAVLPSSDSKSVTEFILGMVQNKNEIEDNELRLNINTGTAFQMQFDLISFVKHWCECEDADQCKMLLHEMETKKEIFLGEFVKALLKINNIASELEKVAECIGDIALLHKLKEIPQKTLKYVATNQSLYI